MQLHSIKQTFISQKCFEQLKQRARLLKKSKNIPHHEALEISARETKVFSNWHEVSKSRKASEISEQALKTGLIVFYTHRDHVYNFDNFYKKNSHFVQDGYIKMSLKEFFFEEYCNSYVEDAETGEIVNMTLLEECGEAECESLFEDSFERYTYFRYVRPDLPKTPKGALGKVYKHNVINPCGFFLNGVYYMRDPYSNKYKEPPFFVHYLNLNCGTKFNIDNFQFPDCMYREIYSELI